MKFKVAFLVSNNLLISPDQRSNDQDLELREDIFELDEQFGKLKPAFAAQDLYLDVVPWRGITGKIDDYDAVLPLMVWDYFEGNEASFMTAMAKVSGQALLLNPYEVLKWNANKSYLTDLETRGAPVIPTLTVEQVTGDNLASACEVLNTDKLVIKPQIGGGAWRQVLYSQGEPFPNDDLLPPDVALIQPFFPSIQTEGEYSFLYFDGIFSHAVLKQAKAGDYRIQSIYGGRETTYVPTEQERDSASDVLDVLDFTPLYARVDLIRGQDGQLKLIELEMIEPYLYLAHARGQGAENTGAQMLAKALRARIEKTR